MHSKLSLSGLLNCLDGIGAAEGRILFATTNKYTSLDPALIRPGRMDVHIEFKLASKCQARELFHRFYKPVKSIEDSDESDDRELSEKSEAQAEAPAVAGTGTKLHKPAFSNAAIKTLASQFADFVPERQLSMATLQGFLMSYKTRPFVAVEMAPSWLEQEMAKHGIPKRAVSVVEEPKT